MTLNLVPTMYTHVKCEGPMSYQSRDMVNVKVSADKQTDKRTGQNLYAPDLAMWGHENQIKSPTNPNQIILST